MEFSLRTLKNDIIKNLSPLEKGCLNHYALENLLIEQYGNSFDYEANAIDADYSVNVDNVLSIIRDDVKYWTENSEIYMNILKQSDNANDVEFTNKALYSIYNYIHLNPNINFSDEKVNEDIVIKLNENEMYKLEHGLIETEDNAYYCFNFNILRDIYRFLLKDRNDINVKDKIKIQNMLLYFILANNIKSTTEIISLSTLKPKKYLLRREKKIDEEKEIKAQIKIIELQDKLAVIKENKNIKEFMNWCHLNEISPYEGNTKQYYRGRGSNIENEILSKTDKLPFILKTYTILHNIIVIGRYYISHLSDTTQIEESNENNKRLLESIQNEIYDENSEQVRKVYSYYIKFIDSTQSNKESNDIMIRISNRLNNINEQEEKKIKKVCEDYVHNYYYREDTIAKRKYYEEYAGLTWSKEDMEKFELGCQLYKGSFLPNNKIAKFMGNHIFTSHVKAIRNRISKEFRKKTKMLKSTVIEKMRKKKNKKWKILPINNNNSNNK